MADDDRLSEEREEAIRLRWQRHQQIAWSAMCGDLLAEVDRLREDNDRLRDEIAELRGIDIDPDTDRSTE